MEREALKLALEALEAHADIGIKSDKAIAAIKEALAQPAQEPVAGTKTWFEDGKVVTQYLTAKDIYKEPAQEPVTWAGVDFDINTTPSQRPWVGMPEDEKEKFVIAYYPSNWDRKTAVALMNNYEAYLKEKNT